MDWCVSLRPAISPERLWSNSVFSLTNVGSGNCAAALWGPIFYTVLEEKMKKLETCLIWIKKVVLGINGCKHISDAPLISKLRYIKQYVYDLKTTLVQLRFQVVKIRCQDCCCQQQKNVQWGQKIDTHFLFGNFTWSDLDQKCWLLFPPGGWGNIWLSYLKIVLDIISQPFRKVKRMLWKTTRRQLFKNATLDFFQIDLISYW